MMLQKIEGRRKRATEDETVGWHHQLHEDEIVKDREAWHAAVLGTAESDTINDWTTTIT